MTTTYAPHMTPIDPPIQGFHILPAIPPWCKEVRVPVELIKRDGNRVLLRDLEMAAHGVGYLIDDEISSFRGICPKHGECLDETGECEACQLWG